MIWSPSKVNLSLLDDLSKEVEVTVLVVELTSKPVVLDLLHQHKSRG